MCSKIAGPTQSKPGAHKNPAPGELVGAAEGVTRGVALPPSEMVAASDGVASEEAEAPDALGALVGDVAREAAPLNVSATEGLAEAVLLSLGCDDADSRALAQGDGEGSSVAL